MTVLQLQQTLKAAGYDPGTLDGIWGPKTKAAWVESMQCTADGNHTHTFTVTTNES